MSRAVPKKKYIQLLALLMMAVSWLCPQLCRSQTSNHIAQDSIMHDLTKFYGFYPGERAFVHIDKPVYDAADTIWMKAYVLDRTLSYSHQSGLLYVELLDDSGKLVVRQTMPLRFGVGIGQMPLGQLSLREGQYALRAYTNWMQNAGSATFFRRTVWINRFQAAHWIVRERMPASDSDRFLHLHFSTAEGQLLLLKKVRLEWLNNGRVIKVQQNETDLNGDLGLPFPRAEQDKSTLPYLRVTDLSTPAGTTLLLPLPDMVAPDLQFMPESGALVAGFTNQIGFKAIGADGRGLPVRGLILDHKGDTVTQFHSQHLGMGVFHFKPTPGESYWAKIDSGSAIGRTYPLPIVKREGVLLQVRNLPGADSLYLTLLATPGFAAPLQLYTLLGLARDQVCFAGHLRLDNGRVTAVIPKSKFPSGVVHFCLFADGIMPLAERLCYVDHHDGLQITAIAPVTYTRGDSVRLSFRVTDHNQQPVAGNFSVAITDDQVVRADSTNSTHLPDAMLLTAELKGYVEQPGYYFEGLSAHPEDLDVLLLTQGWVAYDWSAIANHQYRPAFSAEPEFEVTGRVTRALGKATGQLPVALLSTRKPAIIKDTLTDATGAFTFKNFPRMDSVSFIVQVADKKGKVFAANIQIDQFRPAPVPAMDLPIQKPWYLNSAAGDVERARNAGAYLRRQENAALPPGAKQLKEVVIRAKKSVKGSHNLNGPGNADQILDETDIAKTPNLTLMELLLRKVKGFRKFGIYEKDAKFVIDGIDVDFFYDGNVEPDHYVYLEQTIDQLMASDIKGIEVLYNNQYNGRYTSAYDPEIVVTRTRPRWPAYIEITTWSGNGLFQRRRVSAATYTPPPVSWPSAYYHPKFLPKDFTAYDLRATVMWSPMVITDQTGTGSVTFYTKNRAGHYTAIIEGADLNALTGYKSLQFSVK